MKGLVVGLVIVLSSFPFGLGEGRSVQICVGFECRWVMDNRQLNADIECSTTSVKCLTVA